MSCLDKSINRLHLYIRSRNMAYSVLRSWRPSTSAKSNIFQKIMSDGEKYYCFQYFKLHTIPYMVCGSGF